MMKANVMTVAELRTGYAPFTKKEAMQLTQPTLLLTGERSIRALQARSGNRASSEMESIQTKNDGTMRPPAAAGSYSNFRWVICALLFFAATVNYVDRQVIGILKNTLEHELH